MQDFVKYEFGKEGLDDAALNRGAAQSLARGSRNLVARGGRGARTFRGLKLLPGLGSRLMFPLKNTYGGLDDVGGQTAFGTLFSWLAEMLIYAGHGQVMSGGTNITGALATSQLQFLLKYNGSYNDPKSGPYYAGYLPPSAPQAGLVTTTVGGTPNLTGTVSFKIAWVSTLSGNRSRASASSAIVTMAPGKGAYLVIGSAPAGATNLIIFNTKQKFGGLGLAYRNGRANPFTGMEYTVDDIQRTISDLSVTNGTNVVTSAGAAVFTAGDVGKRFAPGSSGFAVPAGTVITQYNSPTSVNLSSNVTVTAGANPRTADVISYVNNIDRAILLNWTESDLTAETAWIEDYPPPACSHVFALENVLGVIAFPDARQAASATNPGSTAAFSLPNQPGSFNPLHKLYFPETVVGILGRAKDNYVFVAGNSTVVAVQYVNSGGESVPATLSVLLPTKGIQNPNNWAITERGLYLYAATGDFVRVIEGGGIDDNFADPVQAILDTWTPENTVVTAGTKGAILTNGNIALIFDERTSRWSAEIYLSDFAPGAQISGVMSKSESLITLEQSGVRLAYKFDRTNDAAPKRRIFTAIGQYTDAGARGRAMSLLEVNSTIYNDATSSLVWIGIHKNARATHLRDVVVASGSPLLNSASAKFSAQDVGSYLLIENAGTVNGMNGNNRVLARIKQVVSPSQVRLGTPVQDLSNSVDLIMSNTAANGYAVFAYRIYQIEPGRAGNLQLPSIQPILRGLASIAASITAEALTDDGQPLDIVLSGNFDQSNNWRKT